MLRSLGSTGNDRARETGSFSFLWLERDESYTNRRLVVSSWCVCLTGCRQWGSVVVIRRRWPANGGGSRGWWRGLSGWWRGADRRPSSKMSVTDSNCNCAKLNRWEKKISWIFLAFFFPSLPSASVSFQALDSWAGKKNQLGFEFFFFSNELN